MGLEGTAVALFGGGGHARAVMDVVLRAGGRIALVVAPELDGFPELKHEPSDDDGIRRAAAEGLVAVLGIGDHQARTSLASRIEASGVPLPPVVAATATVAQDASVGPGSVVLEHAHIGPRATLRRACIVNTGAIVEHDVTLGEGSFVAPGAVMLGGVKCGARVEIGAGAVVLPLRSLGARVVVGAGAAVVDDLPDGTTAVGVPARPIDEG